MKKKFCPKCKSTNIEIKMTPITSKGAPAVQECQDCGFIGYMFPEKEINKKKKLR